jgi:hypothetical protein
VWGELYNCGLKVSYARGIVRFTFTDAESGKEYYSIACDLRTSKGRFIADEIIWSHAFPIELFTYVDKLIKRWVHVA